MLVGFELFGIAISAEESTGFKLNTDYNLLVQTELIAASTSLYCGCRIYSTLTRTLTHRVMAERTKDTKEWLLLTWLDEEPSRCSKCNTLC